MAATKTTSTSSKTLLSFFLFFNIIINLNISESKLTLDYYKQTCPQFQQIIQQTVTSKQIQSPTTAAATLRLFLHDCLLPNGCDASVLLSSTPFNKAERDNDINLSLPGDSFDLIVRIKTALELSCPNTVSCSDILATATRDLLIMLGGPHYNVYLGRRDGRASVSSFVDGFLPKPSMTMTQIVSIFTKRGFTVEEMVALSGAHTVGFSHCSEISSDIYNNSSGSGSGYNPRFVEGLKKACGDYKKNPTLSVFNDIMTPNKFDNVYFQNLPKGLGVLKSDHGLFSDPSTKPFVERFAKDQDYFFKVFASSMQKLSLLNVQTGRKGEIRRRCDQIN
ncbi:putative peroxidase [Medicago truncatula]|uniref:Peroxidase n=1 Tax=Medicago truncatula TaxID=3880 RepID=I3T3G6_MEDTR|nr:peroxidase 31 [Medicago truncatula]AFK47058.1 unknown [Medicago truncatula]KEH16184.1 peroxidase family protein [Medicago truncatula]KEH24927.1 peroxidase family protein [Medicago truncatula]RHN49900.1 putative peroxidase [Medicago truncatula]